MQSPRVVEGHPVTGRHCVQLAMEDSRDERRADRRVVHLCCASGMDHDAIVSQREARWFSMAGEAG